MPGLLQDLLGNVLMFSIAFYLAHFSEKRKLFILRVALCFVAFCLLRWLYFNVIISKVSNDLNIYFQSFGFVVLLTLLTASVYISHKSNIWTAIFCASVSYGFQHIVQRLYMVFTRIIFKNLASGSVFWNVVIFVAIMCLSFAVLFIILKRLKISTLTINSKYVLVLSLVIIGANIFWENWSFKAIRIGGDTGWLCARIAGILIAGLTISLQFTLLTARKVQLERDKLKTIIEEERKQYYFEKSLIDVINIKAHDLKHRYSGEEFSQSDKAVVDAYDATFKTGCGALDVVLTKKAFECRDKEIELTCMANGELLDFIEEVDVYSLFGNILDNAIEATQSLEDKTKRVISLIVCKESGFIRISESNYFSGTLDFNGSLPKTTKNDTNFHGYGLRSIKMIVEHYGGSMRINCCEDCFELNLVIPLCEK